jgi:hypothetical protein
MPRHEPHPNVPQPPERTRAAASLDPRALGGARCRFAADADDHRRAAALVHEAYVERGLRAPSPDGLHLGAAGHRADLAVLLLADGDDVRGTMTLIPDHDEGFPADRLFPVELAALRRGGGRRLVEVALFAVPNAARGTGVALILAVAMMRLARALAATDIVIQVHPSSEGYYREVLAFRRLGEVRPYPGLSERAATALLHHDIVGFDAAGEAAFGDARGLENPYHLVARLPIPADDLSPAALDASRAARAAWLDGLRGREGASRG